MSGSQRWVVPVPDSVPFVVEEYRDDSGAFVVEIRRGQTVHVVPSAVAASLSIVLGDATRASGERFAAADAAAERARARAGEASPGEAFGERMRNPSASDLEDATRRAGATRREDA